jgi:hypothetical protein
MTVVEFIYFPGTPASSTTKTGRHDIAEILLKVALNTKQKSSNPKCKLTPIIWSCDISSHFS